MFRKLLSNKKTAMITLIRHAETVWNYPQKRLQGQSRNPEIILSENGKLQASRYLLAKQRPNVLIVSPLLRCVQTAEEIFHADFENIACHKYIEEDLQEIDVGKLEGLYIDEINENHEVNSIWNQWRDDPLCFNGFPDGETLAEFNKRVLHSISKICYEFGSDPSNNILIVTHGGPIRILKCFLKNKELSHLWEDEVVNLEQIELTHDQIERLQHYYSGNCFENSKLNEVNELINTRLVQKEDKVQGVSKLLFSTENFNIFVVRENQRTPGILDVIPKDKELKKWSDFNINQIKELNSIQRRCEELIIKTFHSQASDFDAEDDKKILINSYAREKFDKNGLSSFKLRIYPRYSLDQNIALIADENRVLVGQSDGVRYDNSVILSDPTPGKPFQYLNPLYLEQKTYDLICDILAKNIKIMNEEKFELGQDDISSDNHDNCFMCTHPKNHIDKVGVMQLEIKIDDNSFRYNISLDARDQFNPGRGYVVPVNHVNSLRKTSDMSVALLHKLADAFQRAAEKQFNAKSDMTRTYDRAVLMNLYKPEEGGPHVHLHVVPREVGCDGYQLEYPMLSKDYVPFTKDENEKEQIVRAFSRQLHAEVVNDAVLGNMEVKFLYIAEKKCPSVNYGRSGEFFSLGMNSDLVAADEKQKVPQVNRMHK